MVIGVGLFYGLFVFVHLMIAFALHTDAKRVSVSTSYLPYGPILLSPLMWGLTGLAGGPVALLIYWIIHHSKLNPRVNNTPAQPRTGE